MNHIETLITYLTNNYPLITPIYNQANDALELRYENGSPSTALLRASTAPVSALEKTAQWFLSL